MKRTATFVDDRHPAGFPHLVVGRGCLEGEQGGRRLGQPEALSALGRVMALNEEFRSSRRLRRGRPRDALFCELAPLAPAPLRRQENYRGGHMFYTRTDPRRAFRGAGGALYGGGSEA